MTKTQMLDLNLVLQIITENPKVIIALLSAFLLITGIIVLNIDNKNLYGTMAIAFGFIILILLLEKGRKK
jgi:hypothetical protein